MQAGCLYPTLYSVLLDFSECVEKSRWFSHVWFEMTWLCILFLFQTSTLSCLLRLPQLTLLVAAGLLFNVLSPSFKCDDPSESVPTLLSSY